MKKISVKIETKNYDISIHETMTQAVDRAISTLGSENISAKKLLEAYLAKVIECEQLQSELHLINKEIDSVTL